LGHPTEIEKFGTVVAVAGGVGTAEVLPVIKDLLKAETKSYNSRFQK
jgi:ferredoxin--NADP+ reductase